MNSQEFAQRIEDAKAQAERLQQYDEMNPEYRAQITSEATQALLDTLEELHVAEEELRQSNEELLFTRDALEAEKVRYQTLFEFAPDGYLVTDPLGIIRDANLVACTMLGVENCTHVQGKPLTVFVHRDDYQAFSSQLAKFQKDFDYLKDWELTINPREGRPFPVSATIAAILNEDSELAGLRWMLRDISAAKKAQEMLQESEEKYRTLFTHEPDAVFMVDEDSGKLVDANPVAAELYGYSRDELLKMKAWDLSAEPEKTKKVIDVSEKEGLVQIPVRYHKKKDGTVFPVEITAGHCVIGERNINIAMIRDISLHVQAEETLQRWNEELEETVEERTAEMKVVLDATVGREVRMAELKRVIKKLRGQLKDAGMTPVADDPLFSDDPSDSAWKPG